MKNKILEELNKSFSEFVFYPEDHHYELNGERVGISVTRLIEEYTNEFNAELIAEKVAKRDNKSVQEVLDEWEYKNKFSVAKGSTCHEYAQSLWSGEHWDLNNFDYSPEYEMAIYKIKKQADRFHEDYKNKWEHVADEYVIGSKDYDIASAVDHLFLNEDKLYLIDYKTNTFLTGYNKKEYKKPMKVPLNHLNDDKFTHYKIQLSIYKYIIEKYTDLKIDKMIIVYLSETNDNYEIIEIPYLKKEVEDILEWRLWE